MTAGRYGSRLNLNFRPSLWSASGGSERAAQVNRDLVGLVYVLLGNEEDLSLALGYELQGVDERLLGLDLEAHDRLLERVLLGTPNLSLVATTLRQAHTATINDWSAVCRTRHGFHAGPALKSIEILDRVGGGD